MPKSYLDRLEDEGLVNSYAPKWVREIEIALPELGEIKLKIDHDLGTGEARISVGLQAIYIKGKYLLSESPEIISAKIWAEYGEDISRKLKEYKAYQEAPARAVEWVKENTPLNLPGLTVTGRVVNGSEIRLEAADAVGRWLDEIHTYSIEEAASRLQQWKKRFKPKKIIPAPKR